MSLQAVQVPEPHFIPGYAGFIPQYVYRVGDSFGNTTHKLLLDPTVNHSRYLILSDRTADDYQIYRPPKEQIDIVNSRFRVDHPVFRHPIIPGYEGHLPNKHATCGQTFTVAATEALSSFGRHQIDMKLALNDTTRHRYLQNNNWDPRTTEDRKLVQTRYKLPLTEVSPEYTQMIRNLPQDEPPIQPPTESISPYFSELDDKNKKLRLGYAGHIPFAYAEFGKTQDLITNSALCNFTSNYRRLQSTEWAPANLGQPDPPLDIPSDQIYLQHMGELSTYAGHVPGAKFKFGKSFGRLTRDAKRWLRGDFSM